MINQVVLVGRLTRDPELRRTQSGLTVCSFTIAVDNRSKGQNGERTASFIPCTAWNKSAEFISKFGSKGILVGVEGRLNQRSYESKDNRQVNVVEVICDNVQVLERRSDESRREDSSIRDDDQGYQADPVRNEEPADKNVDAFDVTDDDLPF